MSVDEAARLIHSAAKKMQKENYSSTSVNKMLCLLHALVWKKKKSIHFKPYKKLIF